MSHHNLSPEVWLSARRFHRVFHLSRASKPSLRITYSDIGYGTDDLNTTAADDGQCRTVVIFIGGLMGGRYTLLHLDEFCRKQGIRMITIDRPGMGGSDPVPLQERMATWIATFEGLLDHLNLSNVSIACHSGGAIYATNTLIRSRKYLHHERASIAFFAPFCHSKDSSSSTMTTAMLKMLPGSAIAQFDKAARVMSNLSLSISWSSGLVAPNTISTGRDDAEAFSFSEDGEVDMKWWSKASDYVLRCVLAEDISGASDEALLYLRKGEHPVPWGDRWKSYVEAARIVAEDGKQTLDNLHISVYHAASDNMVGSGGGIYFDKCWRSHAESDGVRQYQYSSQVCEGTNHDSILSPDKQPTKQWLRSLVQTRNLHHQGQMNHKT